MPVGDPQPAANAGVGAPLRHQRKHLALARRELRQWIVLAPRVDELLNEPGVHNRAAFRDPVEALEEVADVGHAGLQQVAGADAAGEQLHRLLDGHVSRQHQDGRSAACSARITRAASSPSVSWSGGMRMSTITTSGWCPRTKLQELRRRRRPGRRPRTRIDRAGSRAPPEGGRRHRRATTLRQGHPRDYRRADRHTPLAFAHSALRRRHAPEVVVRLVRKRHRCEPTTDAAALRTIGAMSVHAAVALDLVGDVMAVALVLGCMMQLLTLLGLLRGGDDDGSDSDGGGGGGGGGGDRPPTARRAEEATSSRPGGRSSSRTSPSTRAPRTEIAWPEPAARRSPQSGEDRGDPPYGPVPSRDCCRCCRRCSMPMRSPADLPAKPRTRVHRTR